MLGVLLSDELSWRAPLSLWVAACSLRLNPDSLNSGELALAVPAPGTSTAAAPSTGSTSVKSILASAGFAAKRKAAP